MARRIHNSDSQDDLIEAMRHCDTFTSFDLTVLTRKQLEVVVMRYCGGLSFRKIASFEGVNVSSIRDRHRLALAKLCTQIPHTSRISRGPNTASWSAAYAADCDASSSVSPSGAAYVVSEGGGHGIEIVSWERMYQQEEAQEEAAE